MINTIDLVNTLHMHHARFSALLLLLEDAAETLTASASLSYTSLVFKLEREESLYVQVTYAFDENVSALTDFYSADPKAGAFLAPYLESQILPYGHNNFRLDMNRFLRI